MRNDLQKFIEAWGQGLPIAATRDGEWVIEGKVRTLFRRLLGNDNQRVIGIAWALTQTLDSLEAEAAIPEGLREACTLVLDRLALSGTLEGTTAAHALNRRLIALEYRSESMTRNAPDISDNALLRQMAAEWKANQELLSNQALTEQDLINIQTTVTYSRFFDLLLNDETTRHQYFTWTIRDQINPSIFIEFPALQEKIILSNLNGRIGRINGNMIQIKKANGIKIVTLPFEGTPINILDQNATHTFRGNYTLTVAQVFSIFADKFAKAGNLELLADGIINWNFLKMSWWNAEASRFEQVNLAKRAWWKQLPIFEILSLEQARARYGDHVDGKHWNIAAAASRASTTLDYERTHAYLDIAIPIGNGNYAVYDFGKLANEFPTNLKQTLQMFALNVHASVAYPDDSVYYSHREHTYYSFPMTPEQAFAAMDSIRQDILISRQNHFVYQIESDNCAKWAHEKIAAGIGEDNMPNLFQMHLLATEPCGVVSHIFKFIRKLPKDFRTFVLTRMHLPLGAAVGTWVKENGQKVYKSLTNHEFFETGIVYLPAYLHKQQEIGMLGKVCECFEKFLIQIQNIASQIPSFILNYVDYTYPVAVKVEGSTNEIVERIIKASRDRLRFALPEYRE